MHILVPEKWIKGKRGNQRVQKKENENWECESCIMPKTTTMGKLNT